MNVRKLALSMLDEYELMGKYINLALSSHRLDALEGGERGFLTALLFGTVERKLTYDYYISSLAKRGIDEIDLHTLNILRLGVHQLLALDSVPDFAAVNESVRLGRNPGERGFVNGILRAVIRARDSHALPLPKRERGAARYLSAAYSFPIWICRRFISILGEEQTERLLSAYNSQSYTDLTVNPSRCERDALIERLSSSGVTDVHPSAYSNMGVRINRSVDPTALVGFDEGSFFVQDEACAVSLEALGIERGDKIIDVCACPGGKSFAAAMLTGEGGSVLSLDLHESKLSLIESGAERLGLSNIDWGVQDATAPRVELFGSFDRVICDVPCSGLGVLGKKADIRYRDPEGIDGLPELQYSILSRSAGYLRAGGTLVYSTCTLCPDENGGVVRRFLAEHPDFYPVDFSVGGLASDGGMLTLYPHIHNTDGFFIAKLGRKNV